MSKKEFRNYIDEKYAEFMYLANNSSNDHQTEKVNLVSDSKYDYAAEDYVKNNITTPIYTDISKSNDMMDKLSKECEKLFDDSLKDNCDLNNTLGMLYFYMFIFLSLAIVHQKLIPYNMKNYIWEFADDCSLLLKNNDQHIRSKKIKELGLKIQYN